MDTQSFGYVCPFCLQNAAFDVRPLLAFLPNTNFTTPPVLLLPSLKIVGPRYPSLLHALLLLLRRIRHCLATLLFYILYCFGETSYIKMLRRVAAVGLHHLLKSRVPATHATTSVGKKIVGYESFCSKEYRTPALGFSAYRFYCVNGKPDIEEINLSDKESKRKILNRLVYRSKQRGLLELDLVLGKWVEENIHFMDESGIKSLVQVLDVENPTLWKWLTEQEEVPEALSGNPVFSAIREKVKKNLDSYAAPETRAMPGQPWVRGWDDIKRGRDAPISGNQ